MTSNVISKAINLSLDCGIPFYAFLFPGESTVRFGAQTDKQFQSSTGFRIFPFIPTANYPERVIYNQLSALDIIGLNPTNRTPLPTIEQKSTSHTDYIASIQKILSEINRGEADKVVMSRIIVEQYNNIDWGNFFLNLVAKYPSAFSYIAFTPETGAWIGASPETLGIFSDSSFQTMALAGTRKVGTAGDWDKKDVSEQDYVVSYIAKLFEDANLQYSISPKFSKQAGFVEHLCNMFSVEKCNIKTASALVSRLHPTPALAGFPKCQALSLITSTEHHLREYYGGYVGPFTNLAFNYYVNLRCMKFDNRQVEIFVGGGIIKESIPEKEWNETEVKSHTLKTALSENP